jgi:hypothetical protein
MVFQKEFLFSTPCYVEIQYTEEQFFYTSFSSWKLQLATVGRDADIAQIIFVRLLVNTPSLCLTSTGMIVAMIARRRCRFHLSVGDYLKEVSYFSNAVWLLAIS